MNNPISKSLISKEHEDNPDFHTWIMNQWKNSGTAIGVVPYSTIILHGVCQSDKDKFNDVMALMAHAFVVGQNWNKSKEHLTIPEGSFDVQIGRDATVYFSAILQAESLEELKERLHKTGIECPEDTEWKFDGYDSFDNVEVCTVELPDGTMWKYRPESGWEEET